MFIKDSIRKDIEYAMKVRKIENYEERTKELLEMFRLTDLADRDGRLLSGGQMRRASLAIGIALNPEMLLLMSLRPIWILPHAGRYENTADAERDYRYSSDRHPRYAACV